MQKCQRGADRLPVVTMLLSATAILFQVHADLTARMTFDRWAIAAGEYWRFFTGHLTHWNVDHMDWDVLMFAILGAMIERRSRVWLIATLIASAAAISVVVWCGQAGVDEYRGLSGIDSALFTFVALVLFDDARRTAQTFAVWALTFMATAFVGKLGWELASGSTLFVDSSAAGFTPLPLVHAVGGSAGILFWCGTKAFTTRHSFRRPSRSFFRGKPLAGSIHAAVTLRSSAPSLDESRLAFIANAHES